MDKMKLPVGIFLVLCGVMAFIGYKGGRASVLKKYCVYGSCQGGGQCDCHGLTGRITD